MAITVHQTPEIITPSYNPSIVALSSTNVNEAGHQFIVDVYSAGTSTRLARLKQPANPNGYGVFDIHRVLENYVTQENDFTATGFTNSYDSFMSYNLEIGEEYKFYWDFDDNFFHSPTTNVGFTSSTIQHYFEVGDRISVSQDAGFTYSQYNGVHTVVAVPDSYSVVIDVGFIGSTPANPGTTIYSNSQKTIFSSLESESGLTANNAAFSHIDFSSYDVDDWNMTGGSLSDFFTDAPTNYSMRTNSRAWANYFASSGNTVRKAIIRTYDSADNVEGVYFHNTNTPIVYRNFGVGPWNLSNATISASGGTGSVLPIIKSTTDYYTVELYDNADVVLSNPITIKLDTTCTKYDNIQLVFLDRKGSMMPANFQLASRENVSIERQEYKKPTGTFNGSSWGYNSSDRGRTVYNTDITRAFQAVSNWMTESESNFIEQLFSSPEVYLVDGDTVKPVIITSNTFAVKKQVNEKLINHTISFELAYRDEIQRG